MEHKILYGARENKSTWQKTSAMKAFKLDIVDFVAKFRTDIPREEIPKAILSFAEEERKFFVPQGEDTKKKIVFHGDRAETEYLLGKETDIPRTTFVGTGTSLASIVEEPVPTFMILKEFLDESVLMVDNRDIGTLVREGDLNIEERNSIITAEAFYFTGYRQALNLQRLKDSLQQQKLYTKPLWINVEQLQFILGNFIKEVSLEEAIARIL